MYNYTNSYADTTLAYEYALQQQAAGCKIIMGGASSSSNAGIYQAALELADQGKTIYTTGLSIDQTKSVYPGRASEKYQYLYKKCCGKLSEWYP